MLITRPMERHIHSFGRAAATYNKAGELQRHVANELAKSFAPAPADADILEIGCGTGFLTEPLQRHYGGKARYVITDKSIGMLASCTNAFHRAANVELLEMDGQDIHISGSFDVIATSMTVQWFDDAQKSLLDMQSRLKPGGTLHYATVGHDTFGEWADHLRARDLDFGMRPQPSTLPGLIRAEYIPRNYGSGKAFLDMLKETGAGTPKPNYQRPSPRDFKKAVDAFDGRVTWHILYGRLDGPSL
ncbi:MAG: hypothetical protein DI551_01600 [Micavibrio aeruginosavorus]|uniref:Methyltransferase domain-containing protein n=1 Tax=Micavibrio aeruginosavorus TaxID=349221 RepID=A0A2W5N4N5_9BACT|nr:MAG: hypothetical protein DI551_01600 [Micavibrio aeruginosavorus]